MKACLCYWRAFKMSDKTLVDNIYNIPEYAKDHKYIVFRLLDGDDFFWGAYDNLDRAIHIANTIDGYIVKTSEWFKTK
jgi:hypothetical protein